MSSIQPPGRIELPGMKGTIAVHFDLMRGDVTLDAQGVALPTIVQVLMMAAQGAAAQWAQTDARVIRAGSPEGDNDGSKEASKQKDDNDDGGGSSNNAA